MYNIIVGMCGGKINSIGMNENYVNNVAMEHTMI